MLNLDDIKKLSSPFDAKTLGVKIQSFSKDRTRATLVCYIQHTDAYSRIEEVDPAWNSQILDVSWLGETCFTRMRLTILGASRENVGEGDDPKSSASDALKRCAMLFGVGRYLYDAETVWIDYDERRDKFRTFTVDDYNAALKNGQAKLPTPPNPSPQSPAPAPSGRRPAINPRGTTQSSPEPRRTRAQLADEIYSTGEKLGLNEGQVDQWIFEDFKKTPARMTDAEMEKFLIMLQCEVGRKGA